MTIDWQPAARRLAEKVTRPGSRWSEPVAAVPRHLLVERWFDLPRSRTNSVVNGWELRDGPADEVAWLEAAYGDESLVTRVGPLHADHALRHERASGRATSSATLPTLVVMMLQFACIQDRDTVLDVGTGSGYSAAVLASRLGDARVTSIDIDGYLSERARDRLDGIGLRPRLITGDATGAIPGEFDRLVAMTSVRPIPSTWLEALKPGGRMVTAIANTSLIVTAEKTADGGAVGQVEWMAGGFMPARKGADYPPDRTGLPVESGETTQGRYPVPDILRTWDLRSMLELIAPGIDHRFERSGDGRRTAWMIHPDGSWARASAVGQQLPTVRQGGPRRLWDILDEIRGDWLVHGEFPIRGANVSIAADGVCTLSRGRWQVTIA